MAKNENNYKLLLASQEFLDSFGEVIKQYQTITGSSKSYMKQDFGDLINYFSPKIISKGSKAKDTSWKGVQRELFEGRGRKWVYLPLELIEPKLLEWGDPAKEFLQKVRNAGCGWGHHYSPRLINGKKYGMFELRIETPKYQHSKNLVAVPDEILSSLHRLEDGKTPLKLGLEDGTWTPTHLTGWVPITSSQESIRIKANLETETGMSFATMAHFNELFEEEHDEWMQKAIKHCANKLGVSPEEMVYFDDEELASEKFEWKWNDDLTEEDDLITKTGKVKIKSYKFKCIFIHDPGPQTFVHYFIASRHTLHKDKEEKEVYNVNEPLPGGDILLKESFEEIEKETNNSGDTIVGFDTLIDSMDQINSFIKQHEEKAKAMHDNDEVEEEDDLYFKAYQVDCILNPEANDKKEIKIVVGGDNSYFSDGIETCSLDELIDHLEIVGDFSFDVYLNIILRHFQHAGFENVNDQDQQLKMNINDYLSEM